MQAVIGALRVILGADTAAFEDGLKKGSSRLDKFAATATKAGLAVAAAMATAAIGLGIAIKGQLDEADRLGKMAQSIGIPVEELSKLKHAADLSGVSMESLSKGVARLNRNIVEGAQGLQTPIRAFEALGISIRNTDGSLKTVSELLPELAEKFATMRDGPEKTAFAMQLLGRAGAELIPMLNLGRAGMQEMMQEAEALGLVIDQKTATAAENFNDNLTRLMRVKDGIVTQITARLAPALSMLSQIFIDAAKDSSLMKGAADGIVAAIQGAVKVAYTAITVFQRLGAELTAFWAVLQSDNLANTKKVWSEFLAEGEKTKAAFEAIGANVDRFFADAAAKAEATAPDLGRRMAKPMIVSAEETAKAAKAQEQAAREATRAWEAMWREGNALYEQTRTPLETFKLDMQRLNDLFREGVITADTYNRAVMQLQDQFTGASQFAQGFASSLESAFVNAITSGQKLSEVAKNLLKDLARLAAQSAFRSLISGIFGGGFGGGFKIPGFAGGGMAEVMGAGGIDSQLAMLKVTPGETISVAKKGDGFGGSGMTLVQNNDFSSGITPTDRAFIESRIDAAMRQVKGEIVADIRTQHLNDRNYLFG